MTDNEIIKALECCVKLSTEGCKACPYYMLGHGCLIECLEDTIDLINRQRAEIERLSLLAESFASAVAQDVESCENCACKLLDERDEARAEADELALEIDELIIEKDKLFDEAEALIKNAKAEAVKEFAERLKRELSFGKYTDAESIDNLVKEFTEGKSDET